MAAVAASSHELKCGQKIPAEALVVTRGVEIFVKSKYRGGGGGGGGGGGAGGHSWSYVVEFKNVGVDTVQMLTRHWIFTDATGKVTGAKGRHTCTIAILTMAMLPRAIRTMAILAMAGERDEGPRCARCHSGAAAGRQLAV